MKIWKRGENTQIHNLLLWFRGQREGLLDYHKVTLEVAGLSPGHMPANGPGSPNILNIFRAYITWIRFRAKVHLDVSHHAYVLFFNLGYLSYFFCLAIRFERHSHTRRLASKCTPRVFQSWSRSFHYSSRLVCLLLACLCEELDSVDLYCSKICLQGYPEFLTKTAKFHSFQTKFCIELLWRDM